MEIGRDWTYVLQNQVLLREKPSAYFGVPFEWSPPQSSLNRKRNAAKMIKEWETEQQKKFPFSHEEIENKTPGNKGKDTGVALIVLYALFTNKPGEFSSPEEYFHPTSGRFVEWLHDEKIQWPYYIPVYCETRSDKPWRRQQRQTLWRSILGGDYARSADKTLLEKIFERQPIGTTLAELNLFDSELFDYLDWKIEDIRDEAEAGSIHEITFVNNQKESESKLNGWIWGRLFQIDQFLERNTDHLANTTQSVDARFDLPIFNLAESSSTKTAL